MFHQSSQGLERRRQVPLGQWGGLIQDVDLLLQLREGLDRITAAADHDPINLAAQPDISMAIGDWREIVVGFVAHQCLRTDPLELSYRPFALIWISHDIQCSA